MKKLIPIVLQASLAVVVGYYGLKIYAVLSLDKKKSYCMQSVSPRGANGSEQFLNLSEDFSKCINSRTNYVERLFFTKDEASSIVIQ
jgi:hypothetical protein